jgi:hypothetical protein
MRIRYRRLIELGIKYLSSLDEKCALNQLRHNIFVCNLAYYSGTDPYKMRIRYRRLIELGIKYLSSLDEKCAINQLRHNNFGTVPVFNHIFNQSTQIIVCNANFLSYSVISTSCHMDDTLSFIVIFLVFIFLVKKILKCRSALRTNKC